MCQIREESVCPPEKPFSVVGSLSDRWNGCVSVSSFTVQFIFIMWSLLAATSSLFYQNKIYTHEHSSWNFVSEKVQDIRYDGYEES